MADRLITRRMVDRAALALWESERWRFMESFEGEPDDVRAYFRERARGVLTSAMECEGG